MIQGMILIAITMVLNIVLANFLFSERIDKVHATQNSLLRSVDHIFTALTYLEKDKEIKLNDGAKKELDKARESLREPELLKIRRKDSPGT